MTSRGLPWMTRSERGFCLLSVQLSLAADGASCCGVNTISPDIGLSGALLGVSVRRRLLGWLMLPALMAPEPSASMFGKSVKTSATLSVACPLTLKG
jgi:hypothetical protein